MKKQRDFKGVWIPRELYLNDDLNWTEKILLIEIDSLDNEKGCFASNKYFANFLSKSEVYISNCISKLKKEGYIYQESFDGRTRILRSNLSFKLKNKSDLNYSLRQPKEKVKGSLNENFKAENEENGGNYSNRGRKMASNNTSINKTEEEEAPKKSDNSAPEPPDKISQKYQQIFGRKLSGEMYLKLLQIFSDNKIIYKALEVAEKNGDKPAYLIKLLEDWKDRGFTSLITINKYLASRQENKRAGSSSTGHNKEKYNQLHEVREMEKQGWN